MFYKKIAGVAINVGLISYALYCNKKHQNAINQLSPEKKHELEVRNAYLQKHFPYYGNDNAMFRVLPLAAYQSNPHHKIKAEWEYADNLARQQAASQTANPNPVTTSYRPK